MFPKTFASVLAIATVAIAYGVTPCPADDGDLINVWVPNEPYNREFVVYGVRGKLVCHYNVRITKSFARVAGWMYVRSHGVKIVEDEEHELLYANLEDGTGSSNSSPTILRGLTIKTHLDCHQGGATLKMTAVVRGEEYRIARLSMRWNGGESTSGRPGSGTQPPQKTVLDETSRKAPALAWCKSRLYLAWTGTDHRLNLASSPEGKEFAWTRTYQATSNVAPAMTVFKGKLHLAWTGTDGRLNLAWSPDGEHFARKRVLPETSSAAPALTTDRNRLCLAWTGTDRRLNRLYSPYSDHSVKHLLQEMSDVAPAACALGIIAWTGTDQRLNVLNWVPPF